MQEILQTTMKTQKILKEGSESAKRASILLIITGFLLLLLLALSYIGTGTTWTCELDTTEGTNTKICQNLRKDASCMSLAGPLHAEILLNINNEVKASASIVCPWENAISEIRVCFILAGFLLIVLSLAAISKEDKKLAEMTVQASYFFSLLLAIAGSFDLYAVQDSVSNNFSLCNLTDHFSLEPGVKGERMECSHDLYLFTGYLGFVCSFFVLNSALQVKNWKFGLSINR